MRFLLLAVSLSIFGSSPEEEAIRSRLADFTKAENARDPATLSTCFAPEGEVSVQDKTLAKGRTAIAAHVAKHIPWTEVTGATYQIKQLRVFKDVAFVEAERTYFGLNRSRSSLCTLIFVKEPDGWRVLFYRNVVLGRALAQDSPFQ